MGGATQVLERQLGFLEWIYPVNDGLDRNGTSLPGNASLEPAAYCPYAATHGATAHRPSHLTVLASDELQGSKC